jgi:hypothetical protein
VVPDRSRLTLLIVGAAALLGVVALVDAFRSSDGETAAPTTTDVGENGSAPAPSAITRIDAAQPQRLSRTVGGIPFSFVVRTVGWEAFGRVSINKSIVGPQGAEAIIFWASFPDGDSAEPCADVLSGAVGRSTASLAAEVAKAPGTELVAGPSDVTLGGRSAKHVVLTLRRRGGCKPGFFYRWQDEEWGALWPRTDVGATIRVWIVEVEGTRLFIEAETNTDSDPQLDREVVRIVESIRFD